LVLADEESAAKFSMFDIEIPIIGNDVFVDPKSIAATLCDEQLAAAEVSWSDFCSHNERSSD